ncbi:MAG: hypothetical protein COC09_03785 [Gammaproteobacteria bacterium]|nr:MAG: hypothetical protein COC09_03785 [Gammaproteobacteria bacterium]
MIFNEYITALGDYNKSGTQRLLFYLLGTIKGVVFYDIKTWGASGLFIISFIIRLIDSNVPKNDRMR